MRAIVDALLAVLIAPDCLACGSPLDEPTRGPVCAACWSSIPPLAPPLCESCGEPLAAWRTAASAKCPRCRRARRFVDRAVAWGAYDGALRAIVQALKYDGRRSLAEPLANRMREAGQSLLIGADAAVPVPLHPSRHRQRGFNQAADLAAGLRLPLIHALCRTRATPSQSTLPAALRHGNVRDAFAPRRSASRLAGGTVVLVDDVSTTGATVEACARVLKECGVREIRALTAARAVSIGAGRRR